MDRENVIKALGICAGENDFSVCINEKCPYIGGSKDGYCITNLERDALALLKEQEAKPVEVCGQMFTVKYGHCPKCGKGMDSEAYPHWCGFCGQAVKWE